MKYLATFRRETERVRVQCFRHYLVGCYRNTAVKLGYLKDSNAAAHSVDADIS